MRATDTVWFNGSLSQLEKAAPSVASNSLNLGLSVFDGIMAYWNEDHWYVHEEDAHFHRFLRGAKALGIDVAFTVDELKEGLQCLLELVPRTTHYVRPIAYWKGREPFFHDNRDSASTTIFVLPTERDLDGAFTAGISAIQRVPFAAIPAAWKVSGAYVNSFMASQESRNQGVDIGLMLDGEGHIAEASNCNVFFVQDDRVVTPVLTPDIFPGITRSVLLQAAQELGLGAQESTISPGDIDSFDGAFVCGTLNEVRPLSRIGRKHLDTATPAFLALRDRFRRITHA